MAETRCYDAANRRLVYYSQAAKPEYWDQLWRDRDISGVVRSGYPLVGKTTSRFLAPPARVLEGGCGRGNGVYELHKRGFDAHGVDFAPQTVAKLNEHAPEIRVSLADVRSLPYEASSFDGYWSLGVIEHFWEGYAPIQAEMHRVLRPGGFLFLTVPSLSPLRQLKAMLGGYPSCADGNASTENFYQFVLSPDTIVKSFADAGFEKVEFFGYDAIKGLKDEIGLLKRPLQYIYDKPSRITQLVSRAVEQTMSRLSYHVGVYILRKR